MMIRARDYQSEAVTQAFATWDKGERGHLTTAPTAAGKSFIFSTVAKRWHDEGRGRILALAQDSRELVRQAAENMRRHARPATVGVEMGPQRVDRANLPNVVCASVQTMAKRLADFPAGAFTLIVCDEADHAVAKSWRKILAHFWAARIFGVTATPLRHDGRSLAPVFGAAHQAATHRELIERGAIARVVQQSVETLDLSAVVLPPGDDLDSETVGKIMSTEKHLHAVVEPALRLATDRATIVFAATVAHAQALAAMFNRYRPDCARAVWGAMPAGQRKATLDDFAARRFQFLVNVMVLGRGVDLPFVSCVAMARPTQSTPLYEHAIGRGWRMTPGKTDLLVLDFCDQAATHWLVSAVDVLAGKEVEGEDREVAREVTKREGGADVIAALAGEGVDDVLRARVRARVRVRLRMVDLFRAISDEDWKTKTNAQIARELGIPKHGVFYHRPNHIPSPARSIEWKRRNMLLNSSFNCGGGGGGRVSEEGARNRREKLRARMRDLSPEERSMMATRRAASMTSERRSEIAKKANATRRAKQQSANPDEAGK